jgi:lipid-A-disaccharide synthase-like uncharacterized protein
LRPLPGVHLSFDAIHVIGYLGALGSLLFGSNQLRVILQHQSAKDVGVFDYALRVASSGLLGIYAIGTGDLVFVVVNFGGAILSLAVASAAFAMKKEHGDLGHPGSPAKGQAGGS